MLKIPTRYRKLIVLSPFIVLLFIVVYIAFTYYEKKDDDDKIQKATSNKLAQIKQRGKLIALTNYNSTDYFIFRGHPMGYQFELLKNFAKYLDVDLEIVVSNSIEKSFRMLNNEEVDIIAVGLTITNERNKIVQFTIPHSQTRQVLVQKLPDGWKKMGKTKISKLLIRNQLELGGKTIHIQKNTSFKKRLESLSEEIGDSIIVVEDNKNEMEQLVIKVAKGEIDYTICDEHIAMVNKTYYPNIDISTAISFPQNLAWAVKVDNDSLLNEINKWIAGFNKTRKYKYIYRKYFILKKTKHFTEQEFHSTKGGKISKYDELIKKYSKNIGWDWRLLASLIYQESHFHPETRSWAGAFGLMQLMPVTAKRFGVDMNSSPEEQIKAGVKLLKWLSKRFENENISKDEQIKFVLASYNVGLGHILDAINLSEKYGKNPNVWTNNVDSFLLRKSSSKYYRDPVTKHGYARGEETFGFVKEILQRYEHYKNLIPE